jgi:hypothetical protein
LRTDPGGATAKFIGLKLGAHPGDNGE